MTYVLACKCGAKELSETFDYDSVLLLLRITQDAATVLLAYWQHLLQLHFCSHDCLGERAEGWQMTSTSYPSLSKSNADYSVLNNLRNSLRRGISGVHFCQWRVCNGGADLVYMEVM